MGRPGREDGGESVRTGLISSGPLSRRGSGVGAKGVRVYGRRTSVGGCGMKCGCGRSGECRMVRGLKTCRCVRQ